jgi:hypothetical protein
MESGYSSTELAEIHLVLEEYNAKVTDAVRRYREKYPSRSVLNRRAFICVDHRLREMGTFQRSAMGCWLSTLCTQCTDGCADPRGI